MKDLIKFAAVGVAGYLIGFYDMKYKMLKCITEGLIKTMEKDTSKDDSKENEEEEV